MEGWKEDRTASKQNKRQKAVKQNSMQAGSLDKGMVEQKG